MRVVGGMQHFSLLDSLKTKGNLLSLWSILIHVHDSPLSFRSKSFISHLHLLTDINIYALIFKKTNPITVQALCVPHQKFDNCYCQNLSSAEVSFLFAEQNERYQSLSRCFIVCNTHKNRNRKTSPPFSFWLMPNENNEMDMIQAYSSGTRKNIQLMKLSITKKRLKSLKAVCP